MGGEERVENLARQAIAPFHKTFAQRYEQWKRADLLRIALETMPKQLKDGEVSSNQANNLESDRVYNKEIEELQTLYKQKKIDKDTFLRLWQIVAYSRMSAAGYVHTHTSPDGTKIYFKRM